MYAFAPTGSPILGTLERLSGRAEIVMDSYRREADGRIESDFGGGSEIFYDDQRTEQRDGEDLFLDEDGREWKESELVLSDQEGATRGAERIATDSGAAPQGKILGAALLRLTAEAYQLLDPKAGTPRKRWQWLLALHAATRRLATWPRRRPRMAAAAHRQQIRQAYRTPGLAL